MRPQDGLVKSGSARSTMLAISPPVYMVDVAPLRLVHAPRSFARQRARRPVGGFSKRIVDIILSGTALTFLSPLLLTIAVCIVLESRGPALFLQRRGGYRGRPFLIFKFRTMKAMDDGDDVRQATRDDGRITRFGAFLRRASLDELPQLLNVFRGEMSMVGPRPHAIAHDIKFAAWSPDYRRRMRARPGITGLAQINGSRGLIEGPDDLRERLRHDLTYNRTWSLWLDARIIVQTALLIFRDRQAY